MIRRKEEISATINENLLGGTGKVSFLDFLSREESNGAGRLFSILTLGKNASVGWHRHSGDMEVYYIMEGTAKVQDNDNEPCLLHAGDVMICNDGEGHAIECHGDEDLKFLAIVLYTKQQQL